MLRITALLMLARIKSLIQGAFLHIIGDEGSVRFNAKNQLKKFEVTFSQLRGHK